MKTGFLSHQKLIRNASTCAELSKQKTTPCVACMGTLIMQKFRILPSKLICSKVFCYIAGFVSSKMVSIVSLLFLMNYFTEANVISSLHYNLHCPIFTTYANGTFSCFQNHFFQVTTGLFFPQEPESKTF